MVFTREKREKEVRVWAFARTKSDAEIVFEVNGPEELKRRQNKLRPTINAIVNLFLRFCLYEEKIINFDYISSNDEMRKKRGKERRDKYMNT